MDLEPARRRINCVLDLTTRNTPLSQLASDVNCLVFLKCFRFSSSPFSVVRFLSKKKHLEMSMSLACKQPL